DVSAPAAHRVGLERGVGDGEGSGQGCQVRDLARGELLVAGVAVAGGAPGQQVPVVHLAAVDDELLGEVAVEGVGDVVVGPGKGDGRAVGQLAGGRPVAPGVDHAELPQDV